MQYLAVPILIALTAGTALADPGPLRVQPPRTGVPEEQPTPSPPPPIPPPPPPLTAPPPAPAPAAPLALPEGTPATPVEVTTDDEPDRPGWTGVVAGVGLGTLTPPTMMAQDRQSYVAVGMEVHWERPHGAVRPGVILRPDLLMISAADEMTHARTRLDLSALLGASYGETLFGRLAAGPLATYNTVIKGVDRVRAGVLVEASAGWRRTFGVYAEARKTWGSGITDLGLTVGLRVDLAVLGRLN